MPQPRDLFDRLCRRVDQLEFSAPVAYVYNPLDYAAENFFAYLQRFVQPPKERRVALFLGMNPGPWGMAQTGVPFGTVSNVKEWLGLGAAHIARPTREHPKRPVLGLDCPRDEVSGQRFWGWAEERWESPAAFFAHFFVLNYCPLLFLDEGGRNLTPDKIRIAERQPLLEACDEAVGDFVAWLQPTHLLGIGVFAEQCAERIRQRQDDRLASSLQVGRVLHPSPASPIANRGWSAAATRQLRELGFAIP